jgi:hypothetical protein
MQRSTNNPIRFYQLRPLIFDNKAPKITKRCKTDVVQNLPTDILIQIFDNIIPIKLMRICDDDEVFALEVERILLRLTCKKWNGIVFNLISHAYFDIFRIKVSYKINIMIDIFILMFLFIL